MRLGGLAEDSKHILMLRLVTDGEVADIAHRGQPADLLLANAARADTVVGDLLSLLPLFDLALNALAERGIGVHRNGRVERVLVVEGIENLRGGVLKPKRRLVVSPSFAAAQGPALGQ